MVEKNLVINNRRFTYSGVFSFSDLLEVINKAIKKKGYANSEKRNEEVVNEIGKNIYLELRPRKEKSNYVTVWIKIKLNFRNITQIQQEHNGHKRVMEQGNVEIIYDSWVYTDWEDRWGQGPFNFFMKAFVHKWFYKLPLEDSFTSELTDDTAYLFNQVQSLFQSYRKQDVKYTFEKDVRKSVTEDIEHHKYSHSVEEGDAMVEGEH